MWDDYFKLFYMDENLDGKVDYKDALLASGRDQKRKKSSSYYEDEYDDVDCDLDDVEDYEYDDEDYDEDYVYDDEDYDLDDDEDDEYDDEDDVDDDTYSSEAEAYREKLIAERLQKEEEERKKAERKKQEKAFTDKVEAVVLTIYTVLMVSIMLTIGMAASFGASSETLGKIFAGGIITIALFYGIVYFIVRYIVFPIAWKSLHKS